MLTSPRLLFIVGPTASGKTEFALQAAREIERRSGGRVEILNSDSVQVYKSVDIGTAKPTHEQRAQAPHHLLDFVEPGAVYTAGGFRDDAAAVLADGAKRGVEWFLIVGGSGFYVQALEKGMFDVPPVDAQIRLRLDQELSEKGLELLFAELKERDPVYAEKIKAQDSYRTLRALELMRAFAKPMTQIQAEFAERSALTSLHRQFPIAKIGLRPDRIELRKRIATRTDQMLTRGLVSEVQELRARGFGAWAPMQSVGYREVQQMLDGQLTDSELSAAIVTSTMQLAKRQMTWFQRDTAIEWAPSSANFTEGMRALGALLDSGRP